MGAHSWVELSLLWQFQMQCRMQAGAQRTVTVPRASPQILSLKRLSLFQWDPEKKRLCPTSLADLDWASVEQDPTFLLRPPAHITGSVTWHGGMVGLLLAGRGGVYGDSRIKLRSNLHVPPLAQTSCWFSVGCGCVLWNWSTTLSYSSMKSLLRDPVPDAGPTIPAGALTHSWRPVTIHWMNGTRS